MVVNESPYIRYIHKTSRGRWVVAEYDKALESYTAPMSLRERQRTGLRKMSTQNLDDLERISYSNRASALRRAMHEFGG